MDTSLIDDAVDSEYNSRLLEVSEYRYWDALAYGCDRASIFHQTDWLKAGGRKVAVIGTFDKSGELIGGLPLSYQCISKLTIARPPYLTPYLGPVIFRADGQRHRILTHEKNITKSLVAFAKTYCSFLRVPLFPEFNDTQSFIQSGFRVDLEHTYTVDLSDMTIVWNGLDQDKRRKVRKANRQGLKVELSDDLENFFPLLKHSLYAHSRTLSSQTLENIATAYRSLSLKRAARILFIKDNMERVCAGAVLVWDRRRCYYLLSGMNREIANGNAMALLVWECIRFSNEQIKVREFDFDGSDVPSVEIFFRGFGGHLVPRFSATWGRPITGLMRSIWKVLASGNSRYFS